MRHAFGLHGGFPAVPLLCLPLDSIPGLVLSFCVPTVLSYCSTGISTCCPSATPLGLALGPDLPQGRSALPWKPWIFGRKDSHLYSRYSFRHSLFLKVHSSLRYCFVPLRMLLYQPLRVPQLRCCVSAPDIFGAGPLD